MNGVDLTPFRELYPWDGHFLDRDGVRMHYLDEGEGEPMLLLHGNPTWSFYWRHLVAGLSDTYRVIVPDHVGMGLSDKPDDEHYSYTLASRVADIDALLDHLGIEGEVTLIAHDWGGMIGLGWAVRNVARIRRLVLLNTAGFLLPEGRALPWQLKLIRRFPSSFTVRGLNAFVRGAVHSCSRRPGRMTAAVRAGYMAPYDSWANRIAVHRFVQDIPLGPGDPAHELVQEVESGLSAFENIPVQIFWGEQDFVFDAHFLAEWRRRLPSAEVHSFPDCGHYILEDAHEEITPLLREFLRRNPSQAGGDSPPMA
ncbi:MAG: alpha/beta fold hydrolase [Myxococcota bacterium]|nr:alpha/beta fold hydrolase [Myxococcota bacterium]